VQTKEFTEHTDREWDRMSGKIHDVQTERDRLVLSISVGAFAVSIAFFTAFSDRTILHENWLFSSWAFLATSLFIQLINYQFLIKKNQKGIDFIHEGRRDNTLTPEAYREFVLKDVDNPIRIVMKTFTWSILGLTIVGAVLLVMFAVVNITQAKLINSEKAGIEKSAALISFLMNQKELTPAERTALVNLIGR